MNRCGLITTKITKLFIIKEKHKTNTQYYPLIKVF